MKLVATISAFFWVFLMTFMANGQDADAIIGKWLTEEEKGHVLIYPCESQEGYCGKIVWTQQSEKDKPLEKDKNNPDPEKRDRKILGLEILEGLEYNAEEETWEGGKIYDPEKGKKYKCYAELENPDKLKLRGYVGISLVGRSSYWTRIE